jgi:hypothetical protein
MHHVAEPDERTRTLPGDELIAPPASQTTRAISIDASPADVWSWVIQLGADRGGFYSYDWLENLFGLDIHSASRIVPEWHHREIGELVHANRKGSGGWYVSIATPGEALVLQLANVKAGRPLSRDEGLGWEFTWTFAVFPIDGGGTRLLVRERTAFTRRVTRLVMSPIGLVSFVMTRKMLLGIKQRAEGMALIRPG